MERNRLEAQFKEQLNSREIKPSEMTWSKLDAMLTVAEKPKVKFSWMYIAASILGFLLVSTVYFSQNNKDIGKQKKEVVIQNAVAPKANLSRTSVSNLKMEERESLVSNVVQKTKSKINKTHPLKEELVIIKNNSNENPVAAVLIINQKSEQKSITSQTKAVTVDELLTAVGNPLKKENQFGRKSVVHVNAINLLSQVDEELELSFREKVIEKVGENYQTVKVALANRNLE
ncbi:hypothetical protein [Flavobacterium sp. XS2P39]|uniref:hypothetical protein n=1 Tax=Flavobacterium sp. XS2P39 TaxID=3401725 RepID=UPI003AAD8B92